MIPLLGNVALDESNEARRARDWVRAADEAHTATRWLPWSEQPWIALGEAQLGAGATAAARSSFLEGLDVDSDNWRLWYDLAVASEGQGTARWRVPRR